MDARIVFIFVRMCLKGVYVCVCVCVGGGGGWGGGNLNSTHG